MAPAASSGWFSGRVKAVPSGDSIVIMANSSTGIPPERTVTFTSLMAPKLDVTVRVEYIVSKIGREFSSVFLGENNISLLIVSQGWAKVKEHGQDKTEASPYLPDLLRLEENAKLQGLGIWSKVPGALEASVRKLPPSAMGNSSNMNVINLLAENKGCVMRGIVEQVPDGSTIRVYLLPEFQFVQVFVAGIQTPSMGRKAPVEVGAQLEGANGEPSGAKSSENQLPLTSAQRLMSSSTPAAEFTPDPFGREAKHFTEIHVLNREVRIVLEGVDKFSNLIGSVYFPGGDSPKDLALELVENGLAKYLDWSANMLEDKARRQLKNAELKAKKDRVRIWTHYVPPASDSRAVHDQNFTGKVVEVVSGDCIIVADDDVPFGSPFAERRVYLSSIRSPKMGNPRREEKPAAYAPEAKEFLRKRLIGRQVHVSMEYTRKIGIADGPMTMGESRVMDFGSVFEVSPSNPVGDTNPDSAGNQKTRVNVAELVVARGFGTVIRHRDFEERSNYYDTLLDAEARAISAKKGIHSAKDPPAVHITDLLTASTKQANKFLPFLQRSRRIPAIVEYVLSGHRFKLLIPKETCNIAFSLSGVRCPGRGEPYSDKALALMRRKILQRDVEIEVETVDRNGTFLGTLWESKTNIAVSLLEAGLAKLQTYFGVDRMRVAHLLRQAEQSAKKKRLKVWENYVEGQDTGNSSALESKQKEVLKVVVTEVVDGSRFYIQSVEDSEVASIQQQLASLNIQDVVDSFNPKKGDIVLAQFSVDGSWNRAMVVNAPRGAVATQMDKFEVFYIDYGNQEVVSYSHLRPLDLSIALRPGLAQLCNLAYTKVPTLEEEFGQEAAEYLSRCTLDSSREFRVLIEERDVSRGKLNGQGTGPALSVTLFAEDSDPSVNAAMLEEGLGRLERRKSWDTKERKAAFDKLEEFQDYAKHQRLGIWRYGDIQSDDEDVAPPTRRAANRH